MKSRCLNGFFIAVIAASFITLLNMFFACRSLWLDEGMLAWSFTQRSLGELISEPLEWMQSAPVLYLYITKIITLIFGNTELTLRVFSVFCYCITLVITYFLGKDFKYPLALCAFVAATTPILRYANEFKPYISDCVAVLLVLLLYKLYRQGRFSIIPLTAVFVVLIWFSNASCFFIAAVLIFEFFRTPKKIIVPGICCLISFALYFVVWLYPVIAKGDMTGWWSGQYFPIIPKSMDDLRLIKAMFNEITQQMGRPHLGIALFAIAAFVKNLIKDKSPVIFVAFLGVIIALIASSLTFYPVEDRLWLFIYPISAYLAFYFIDSPDKKTPVLALALLLSTTGIETYTNPKNYIYPGEEVNEIIEYVNQKDDFIYVFNNAVPTYCYKNNYKIRDNVMLGDGYFLEYNLDLDKIRTHDSGYIVMAHPIGEKASNLLKYLEDFGYNIEVVKNIYETKLYYFYK